MLDFENQVVYYLLMSAKFRSTIGLLIAVGLSLAVQYAHAHAAPDAGGVQPVGGVADSVFNAENLAPGPVTPGDGESHVQSCHGATCGGVLEEARGHQITPRLWLAFAPHQDHSPLDRSEPPPRRPPRLIA